MAVEFKIAVYDGFSLDTFAIAELLGTLVQSFSRSRNLKWSFISLTQEKEVKSEGGVTLVTENAPKGRSEVLPCDVLFLASGNWFETAVKDGRTREILDEQIKKTKQIVVGLSESVKILAHFGYLDGNYATKGRDGPDGYSKFNMVHWVESNWVLHEQAFDGLALCTTRGSSGSIDATLHILRKLTDSKVVQQVTEIVEVEWDDGHEVVEPNVTICSRNKNVSSGASKGHIIRNNKKDDKKKIVIGVLIYDSFEMMDTFFPLFFLNLANTYSDYDFQIKLLGDTTYVQSFFGKMFRIDALWSNWQDPLDILLIPGGIGFFREMYNTSLRNWLHNSVASSTRVMTVCSGSAILAKFGHLDGVKATSNKLIFELCAKYGPNVNWVRKARWVKDGKFYTSSGVSAGGDVALALVQDVVGDSEVGIVLADAAGYAWNSDSENDPFAKSEPGILVNVAATVASSIIGGVYMVANVFGASLKLNRLWERLI